MESFSLVKGKRTCIARVHRVSFFRRGIGLMFRTRNTNCLLFPLPWDKRPILTSWFVFFPFVAVWLDKNHRVIATQRINPFVFSIKPTKPADYLLEVPINTKNRKLLSFLVGK